MHEEHLAEMVPQTEPGAGREQTRMQFGLKLAALAEGPLPVAEAVVDCLRSEQACCFDSLEPQEPDLGEHSAAGQEAGYVAGLHAISKLEHS